MDCIMWFTAPCYELTAGSYPMQHIWLFYSQLSTAFASGRAPEVDVRANAATTEIKDRQVTTFFLFLNNHITKPRPGSETRHLRADSLMAGKTQWARSRNDLNAKIIGRETRLLGLGCTKQKCAAGSRFIDSG
jgi:hypothetical protein